MSQPKLTATQALAEANAANERNTELHQRATALRDELDALFEEFFNDVLPKVLAPTRDAARSGSTPTVTPAANSIAATSEQPTQTTKATARRATRKLRRR